MTQVRGQSACCPCWKPTKHPCKEPLWDAKCSCEVAQLEAYYTVLVRGDIQAKGMFETPVLPAACHTAGNQLQPLKIFILSWNLLPVEQDAPQELTPRDSNTKSLGEGGIVLKEQALYLCLQASGRNGKSTPGVQGLGTTGKLCAQGSRAAGKISTREQSKGWRYWYRQRTKKVKGTNSWRGEAGRDLECRAQQSKLDEKGEREAEQDLKRHRWPPDSRGTSLCSSDILIIMATLTKTNWGTCTHV